MAKITSARQEAAHHNHELMERLEKLRQLGEYLKMAIILTDDNIQVVFSNQNLPNGEFGGGPRGQVFTEGPFTYTPAGVEQVEKLVNQRAEALKSLWLPEYRKMAFSGLESLGIFIEEGSHYLTLKTYYREHADQIGEPSPGFGKHIKSEDHFGYHWDDLQRFGQALSDLTQYSINEAFI